MASFDDIDKTQPCAFCNEPIANGDWSVLYAIYDQARTHEMSLVCMPCVNRGGLERLLEEQDIAGQIN
jgi:hypothetical protein